MSTDSYRKCSKCGATPIEDGTISFFRFPKPGKSNVLRARAWAKYCWPEDDWLSIETLTKLFTRNKVLCRKHFEDDCFIDETKKNLGRSSIPGEKQFVTNLLKTLRKDMHLMQQNIETPQALSSESITFLETKMRVSAAQTDVLCTFFEENTEVIKGYKKTPECIDAVQNKWKKITPHLNLLGPPRDHRAWAKYLCDMKAKLKRKRIKWRQCSDGSGPIICSADDFNEIQLRMLQVLRKEADSYTSDIEMEDTQEDRETEDNENCSVVVFPLTEPKNEVKPNNNTNFLKLVSTDTHPSESNASQVYVNHSECNDEFETFGKNIAQQLRALPLAIALETQEMLLALIRKQRLRVLNNTDPLD